MKLVWLASFCGLVIGAMAQSGCPATIITTVTEYQQPRSNSSSSASVPSSTIPKQVITVTTTEISTFIQSVPSQSGQPAHDKIVTDVNVRTITSEIGQDKSTDIELRRYVNSTSCPGVPTSTVTITLISETSSSSEVVPETKSSSLSSGSLSSPSESSITEPTTTPLDPGLSSPTSAPSPSSSASNMPTASITASPGSINGSSSAIDPGFWSDGATPTLKISPGGTFQLPCYTPKTMNFTLAPPPYTTTLCMKHCGVDIKKKTTFHRPETTLSEICYAPQVAATSGPQNPVPIYATATDEVEVPAAWGTCTPKQPYTAEKKNHSKCGPKNGNYQCKKGQCCGPDGKCGSGWMYCDQGCQLNWGDCWKNSTTCKAAQAPTDEQQKHNISIAPMWYDAPDPPDPPFFWLDLDGTSWSEIPCPYCMPISWLSKIFGTEGDCGLLGCGGFDLGWFLKRFFKLQCNIVLSWFCRTLHLKCCPSDSPDGKSPDCDAPICDTTPEGLSIDGNSGLCEPTNPDDCDDNFPDEDGECETTLTVTDQTIYCDLVTFSNGRSSSETCTSTKETTREGCTVVPKTTSVTTTRCSTGTAVITSASCVVKTGANATTTTCPTTSYTTITGCDASNSITTGMTTTCSTYNTVTDLTKSCFGHNDTIVPIVVNGVTSTPSVTCTATASSIHSGCDISASTTTEVSISELVCTNTGVPQIQIVPEVPGGQWPITFGLNASTSAEPTSDSTDAVDTSSSTTTSSITCAPPTVSSLPACTPIVPKSYFGPITEVPMNAPSSTSPATSAAAIRHRADEGPGNGETVTTGYISCYCEGVTQEVWPVSTCSTLLCPNQATAVQEVTDEAAPATIDSSGNIISAASSAATPTTSVAAKRVAVRMNDAGPFLGVGSWLGKFLKW